MDANVIEYKCPCCNAGLLFGGDVQQLKCEYCDNTFDLDTVKAFNESQGAQDADALQWEETPKQQWSETEQETLRAFQCPSCGGELITDDHTVATFCPFCDNPTIMPGRLSGALRPDAVIPFRSSNEDAKAAFQKLCQGKPLLPKEVTDKSRL